MYIIKNIEIYAPAYIGKKDILFSNRIELISDHIQCSDIECIDGSGLKLVPGFIDQHVHITGGGGEGSFKTKAPEIRLSQLTSNGITTVVGLLGTDGMSRSVENLLSKCIALQEEGISAYCLSGSYQYPPVTITGDIKKDIMFVKEIIGCKLALSDHRSPHVTLEELIRLASDIRVASMLSNKPGILLLHMGSEPAGLKLVFEALKQTDIPVTLFRPTHMTRTKALLEDGIKLLAMGGYIDFTASTSYNSGKTILELRERGIDTSHITVSSDGQGSWSNYDKYGNLLEIGISSVGTLFGEFQYLLSHGLSLEEALPYFTSNVAASLSFPKGKIEVGNDADFILLDKENQIHDVIALGKFHVQDKKQIIKGVYE